MYILNLLIYLKTFLSTDLCCDVIFMAFSCTQVAVLKAQVSLQLGKVFSSDNGVSVSIMYSYMY